MKNKFDDCTHESEWYGNGVCSHNVSEGVFKLRTNKSPEGVPKVAVILVCVV